MPGRVHRDPVAPGEAHHLRVDDADRRLGQQLHRAVSVFEHALEITVGGRGPVGAPRRLAGEPLTEPGEAFFVVDVELGVGVLAEFFHVEGEAEGLVRQDVAARFVAQLICAAEMIEVRVRDDRGVHVAHFVARGVEPRDEGVPRVGTGQPGIDDGDTPVVFEQVAVDMAETG